MKKVYLKITVAFFTMQLFFVGCNNIKNSKSHNLTIHELGKEPLNTANKNEDLIVKTLLLNKWIKVEEVYTSSYKELKDNLIFQLKNSTNLTQNSLIALSDIQLSTSALTYRFLKNGKIKTVEDLKTMNLSDLSNSIIEVNKQYSKYSVDNLKGFSAYKNLTIAYDWWFPKNYKKVIENLNNVEAIHSNYKLKDNNNRSTEVLKIVNANEKNYKYLGVYHKMIGRNHFELCLAGSNDLNEWTFITNLGDRAHQGELKKWRNGYLLVNEEDKTSGSNNIQVRYYKTYNDLTINKPSETISLPRSFSKYAEGTPDIREIIGKNPSNSYIMLGFHYFNNGDVDYQAFGILKDFKNWKAWKDQISNYNIIEKGFKGNIGGRSSFEFLNNELIILEAQTTKNDFGQWKLLLGDGAFYTQLNLKTAKNATSFANPGIQKLNDTLVAVTSFLHSKGNHKSESGQLLYISKLN